MKYRNHTVAIIHGIGITKPGYAVPLIAGIRREYELRIRTKERAASAGMDQLNFVEIVWDDLISDNQKTLVDRLKAGMPLPSDMNFLERILRPLFAPLKRGINWVRTDFAAQFVSDVIAYGNRDVYTKIQERIVAQLEAVAPDEDKVPLTIVAHSLGSVIASDLVYDRTRDGQGFHPHFQLTNFFTMGSPLALFALRYGSEAFASPIHVEAPHGQWINIFDRDDPFSYPLKSLNTAYDQAVDFDREVNTGAFGIAHVKYWKNRATQQTIAAKLSADALSV